MPRSEASPWKFGRHHLDQWKIYGSSGLRKGFYNPFFNGDCKNTFINYTNQNNVFFLVCSCLPIFSSPAVFFFLFPFPVVRLNMQSIKTLDSWWWMVGHSPLGWGRSIRFLQASFAMMSCQELGNAKVLMPEKTIPWGVTHFLGAMGVFLLKHSFSRFTIDISSTMVKVSWDSR